MRRALVALVVCVAAAGAGMVSCGRREAPARGGQVQVTRPAAEGNDVGLRQEQVPLAPGQDRLQGALQKLIDTARGGHTSAIPPGTRLLGVDRDGSRVTIRLSDEFRQLDSFGDTGESLAQNALRAAVAQVPGVQTMTVIVGGKPYEGEHSGEWADVPVRDEGARADGAR